jgi:hypothetical protein
MAEGSSLRLRFFKDGVYGTVATLVFSLLGRVEKYMAAVHVVSFGCMALSPGPEARLAALACAYASAAVALADFVAVLLLSCSLEACCAPRATRAPFSLGLPACDASANGWDSQTVAAAAIATVCVGALQSAARAADAADGLEAAHLPGVAYGALRVYQLTWMASGGAISAGLLWLAAGLAAGAAALARLRRPRLVRPLLWAVALFDAITLLVGALGVPREQRGPTASAAGASLALAAALIWEQSKASKTSEEKSDNVGQAVHMHGTKGPRQRRYGCVSL